MNEIAVTPIAFEINDLHRSVVRSIISAIRIGELLTEIKDSLPHGEWGQWVDQNLEFARNTAWRYMRLFEHRDLFHAGINDLTGAYRLLASNPPVEPSEQETPKPMTPLEREELKTRFTGSWPNLFTSYVKKFPEPNKAEVIDMIERWLMDYRAGIT